MRVAGALLLVLGCEARSDPGPGRAAQVSTASDTGRPAAPKKSDERAAEREALFRSVEREAEVHDPRVLAALRRVPRHRFVPAPLSDRAYEDRPLPIGHDQTISQPTVVAVMTAAVAPASTDRCLEIGTGSGYQAAVLAELCARVYSIEYLAPLARFAEENLRGAGYLEDRVMLRTGDGYRGWPEAAPFHVIVVTAAPESVPKPLLSQLAAGGRLVIPVGPEGAVQELELWTRTGSGDGPNAFDRRTLMAVRFVPFLGEGR